MKLTKKQAVEEHRKMWKWIGNEIARLHVRMNIFDLKKEYLFIHNKPIITDDCFCCAYVNGIFIDRFCNVCPLIWPGNSAYCGSGGLFTQICCEQDWIKQADLAYQIADLPEREDKIFDFLEEENETTEKTDL